MRTGTVKALIAAGAVVMLASVAGPGIVSAEHEDPDVQHGPGLDEGTELSVFSIDGNSLQGGHIDAWVNEHPDGDEYLNIGGIPLASAPSDGCTWDGVDETKRWDCYDRYVGYCSEADVDLSSDPMPFSQVEMDGRIKYLTWKHDFEFHQDNYPSGLSCVTLAATQALVWAWVSDPDTGSTVFSNVAGGFDDPLNWDGLTPSAHTDPSPRVGFHSNVDLDCDYWDGTDAELLQAATQAVYDQAVEATAKAGPWTLSQGVGATGVVLTGANGPIEGEVINFQDGTTDGIDVTTDADGFAAWPAGATDARIEGPGATWRTPGPEATGGQDVIFTMGEDLTVNVNDPAPTTTTPDPDEVVELPATGVENTSGFFTLILVSSVLGGGLALVALTRRNREVRVALTRRNREAR